MLSIAIMLKTVIMKRLPLVLLLVGVFAGVAGAQIFQALQRVQILNTGLFTVPEGGSATFYVSLDDRRDGPATRVALRIFDANGQAKAVNDVILQPGQSSRLTVDEAGLYRAHAEAFDPALGLGARREVVGHVEVVDSLKLVTHGVCAPGRNIGGGRD